ncbi:MCE family protein [Rhizobium sp. KVB221]|uniref:MCE family protein n=1 Tax=Rhizobium setariae TaxID=2801340 RepID=A0A936YR88_9HYPH|nr:MlaD family protein [Rhizobium setariae]MBL0372754.1 MCE family protein [Rhizobium setariae]
METKANYAIVGFFTVLVMLLAFGFVYWMSEYGREGEMEMLAIRIPGSVNGLTVGSPVRFNGIQIGSVRALRVDFDDPRFSLAVTEVKADSPVRPGTTAVLEIQGLTGAAYIEMSGGDTSKSRLWVIEAKKPKPEIPIITARQSGVTNILATAGEILSKTDKTMVQLQGFVNDNRAPLTKTISNAEVFSQALKDNAEGVDKFLESVSSLSGTIKSLSGRIDTTLASLESLLKAVDAKKIDTILANAAKVSADLAAASGDVGKTVKSVNEAVATYKTVGEKANKTLDNVDKLMAAIDPQKVQGSIDDIRAAVSDARTAITTFKGVSQDIDKRRADIDKTISNISEMSAKLNKASTRVDGVLAKIDSFLGSGDSSSLMAQARSTLESFKKVADTLNAKIGPIADNLSRFSGSGLRDVEALIGDTRRTMKSLDAAITRFDQDPRRLLFGGDDVKQFDGRVRR